MIQLNHSCLKECNLDFANLYSDQEAKEQMLVGLTGALLVLSEDIRLDQELKFAAHSLYQSLLPPRDKMTIIE